MGDNLIRRVEKPIVEDIITNSIDKKDGLGLRGQVWIDELYVIFTN